MATFMRTENLMAIIRLCVAIALSYLFMAPQVFGQPGIEEKIFEVWKKREAETAKMSVKLKIETKTEAGYHHRRAAGSTAYLPFPIEEEVTHLNYSLLLDSSTRHKIESEGSRFQREIFGHSKEYRIDVQAERGTKSMWKTFAFDEFPEMSRITVYPKTFESDKNFELLPVYLVYRPTDADLNRERDLVHLKFARDDAIDGKKVVVLSVEVYKSLHEYWIEAAEENRLLRLRHLYTGEAVRERSPFIDMQLEYGEPIKAGVPRLTGWRTLYTVNRPPVGERECEMKGTIVDFQLLDSFEAKEFEFNYPTVHVMNNYATNEDYLQVENGERLPLKYSLDETQKQTVKRVLDSLKK